MMSVEVPTYDEFDALSLHVADLTHRVDSLEQRVTALENAEPIPPDPPDPTPDADAVTVHMSGADYIYDPAQGQDVGSFTDPHGRFVMSCIRVKRDDCSLVVDFRATDAWSCIIFEYSNPLVSGLQNLNYTVTIKDQDCAIDKHYANARWRWESCEWPHPLTKLSDLRDEKLLPSFDGSLTYGTSGNLQTINEAPPMSLCGFTPDMGATGGRADIGFVTGWQGEWLCIGGDAMLKTVLLQGEAAFPWIFRDQDTGAILDVIKTYPNATRHWGNGPSGNPQVYDGVDTGIGMDVAHCPACHYLPFLLTGDPFFLEALQGELMEGYMETPRDANSLPAGPQVRGYAWFLRNLVSAADATPDDVPSWILPKQLFTDELERIRNLYVTQSNDGWVYRDCTHVVDGKDRWQNAFWQHDYVTEVVAQVSLRHHEWSDFREYMVKCIVDRNSSDSGWCPGYPTSYWTNTTSKNDYYPEGSFKTWAEVWQYNANYVYTDTPGGVCPTLEATLEKNTTYDYFSAMMAALRLCEQAGSEPAKNTLNALDGPFANGLQHGYGMMEYKYAVARSKPTQARGSSTRTRR